MSLVLLTFSIRVNFLREWISVIKCIPNGLIHKRRQYLRREAARGRAAGGEGLGERGLGLERELGETEISGK